MKPLPGKSEGVFILEIKSRESASGFAGRIGNSSAPTGRLALSLNPKPCGNLTGVLTSAQWRADPKGHPKKESLDSKQVNCFQLQMAWVLPTLSRALLVPSVMKAGAARVQSRGPAFIWKYINQANNEIADSVNKQKTNKNNQHWRNQK